MKEREKERGRETERGDENTHGTELVAKQKGGRGTKISKKSKKKKIA